MKLVYYTKHRRVLCLHFIIYLLLVLTLPNVTSAKMFKKQSASVGHIKSKGETPVIKGYTLVKRNLTDSLFYKSIKGFDPIKNRAIIDLNKLDISGLAIKVNVIQGFSGTIDLIIDGKKIYGKQRMLMDSLLAVPLTGMAEGIHAISSMTHYKAPNGSIVSQKGPEITFIILDTSSKSRTASKSINGSVINGYTLVKRDIEDSLFYKSIKGFDPIKNGATIYLDKLGKTDLAIKANVSEGFKGKVKFCLNGDCTGSDTIVFSNGEASYLSFDLPSGKHTLSSIAYYKAQDGSMVSQKGPEVSFTVLNNINSRSRTASENLSNSIIDGYTLAKRDLKDSLFYRPIKGFNPIKNGAIIDFDKLGDSKLAIRVNVAKGFKGEINIYSDFTKGFPEKLNRSCPKPCDSLLLLLPKELPSGKYTLSSTATYHTKDGSKKTVEGPKIEFIILNNATNSRLGNIDSNVGKTSSRSLIAEKIKSPFEVSLYPNPSTDFINISASSRNDNELLVLRVFDTQGSEITNKEIMANDTNPVRLENLTKGMYVVRIKGSTHNWSGRFIVN